MKAKPVVMPQGDFVGWMVMCPACCEPHYFDERWEYNGDPEKPTFSPSITSTKVPKHDPSAPATICCMSIVDGFAVYSPESTHAHAGKKVPLKDIPCQA